MPRAEASVDRRVCDPGRRRGRPESAAVSRAPGRAGQPRSAASSSRSFSGGEPGAALAVEPHAPLPLESLGEQPVERPQPQPRRVRGRVRAVEEGVPRGVDDPERQRLGARPLGDALLGEPLGRHGDDLALVTAGPRLATPRASPRTRRGRPTALKAPVRPASIASSVNRTRSSTWIACTAASRMSGTSIGLVVARGPRDPVAAAPRRVPGPRDQPRPDHEQPIAECLAVGELDRRLRLAVGLGGRLVGLERRHELGGLVGAGLVLRRVHVARRDERPVRGVSARARRPRRARTRAGG